ncbi:asparaginase [Granulosicoccus sp.]|nr:asparaginase [Granulosicoccus sp.]MDB4223367.1 asparaginase [Granulosicoccus sp.]
MSLNTADEELAITLHNSIPVLRHRGSLVVLDAEGTIILSRGDAKTPVFARSVLKPFRALALRQLGLYDEFSLPAGSEAIISGSHSGTIQHTELVEKILTHTKNGLEYLSCGIRAPLGHDAIMEMSHTKHSVSALTCDCSGEHAGAILGSVICGQHPSEYLMLDGAVQDCYQRCIDKYFPKPISSLPDLCGMPTYAWSLKSIANAWRKFNLDRDEVTQTTLKNIRLYPYLYAGKERVVTKMLNTSRGNITGKDGASGLYVYFDSKYRITTAVKMSDGSKLASLTAIGGSLKRYDGSMAKIWLAEGGGEYFWKDCTCLTKKTLQYDPVSNADLVRICYGGRYANCRQVKYAHN